MDFFKKLIRHELVTGSFYIFAGSMFANILAFILNLFLARNLSYSDYAIFASLLSLVTLASIPSGSFMPVIVKFATDFFSKGEESKLKAFYFFFLKFVVILSLLIVFLSFILSPLLVGYLHLDNSFYVVVTGFAIASFYLMNFHNAFLQSLFKFGFISFVTAFGGLIKLVVGVVLIIFGFKAFSGLWAIFFMAFGMFLVAYIPISKILKVKESAEKIKLNLGEIFKYSVPSFLAILCMTSFISTDVILAKHFFNPHTAGYYAGLSLIGRVIFYFTAPIPMVMFPLLVKRHATGKTFVNLFYLSLFLVILPSSFITAFYFIRPAFVINLFLGGREYLNVTSYLGLFGLYITIFSLVNVFVGFFISLNKTKVVYPILAAAISQIVLIYIFHTSFYEIIGISLFVLTILLISLFFYFIKSFGNLGKIRKDLAFFNSQNV